MKFQCPSCANDLVVPKYHGFYDLHCKACSARYSKKLFGKGAIQQVRTLVSEAPGLNASKGLGLLVVSLMDEAAPFGFAECMTYMTPYEPSRLFNPTAEHMMKLAHQLIMDSINGVDKEAFIACAVEVKECWPVVNQMIQRAGAVKAECLVETKNAYFDGITQPED